MRFLVPAVSSVLIAVAALSASAATPATETRTATTTAPTTAPMPTRSSATTPPTTTATTWGTGADGPAANTTRVATRVGFVWPLSPRPVVLRRFEQPRSQWSSGHRGVDLSGAVGEPVLSAGEGVVAFSGVIAGRGVITVRHPGGLRTTYEPVDQRLASATVVHQGDPIGVISSTPGHWVPLSCLHWGAIAGGIYRDPLSLLSLGRPILLPLG